MEKEGISTFSIHGFPWALRYLLIFENCFRVCVKKFVLKCLSAEIHFMATLVSVLKRVIKCFENFFLKSVLKVYGVESLFEQVPNNYLPTQKKTVIFLLSLRQCYPSISE